MFEPSDPRVIVEPWSSPGRSAAVEARGTGRANGTPYRNAYAFFVEFEDGRVRAVREYMDGSPARCSRIDILADGPSMLGPYSLSRRPPARSPSASTTRFEICSP
jgi:hypothetical protein